MTEDWRGSDEHKAIMAEAVKNRADVHTAVAERFGITRQAAKLANWGISYGVKQPGDALESFGQLTTVGGCLLSDMHHNLHRGERCPECGYCFEEIG